VTAQTQAAVPSPDEVLEAELDRVIAFYTRRIEEWDAIREAATAEAASLRRQRAVLEGMRHRRKGVQLRLVEADYPPKPQAVLTFLREYPDQSFRLVEIRRELIARGMMADTKAHVHALEVAVRMMEKRGEVTRPRKGIYKLADAREALATRTDEADE
jgi:hypothetical protein